MVEWLMFLMNLPQPKFREMSEEYKSVTTAYSMYCKLPSSIARQQKELEEQRKTLSIGLRESINAFKDDQKTLKEKIAQDITKA